MDLKKYNFKAHMSRAAFGDVPADLLKEAHARGFNMGANNKYVDMFSTIFFKEGAKRIIYKKDLPENFRKDASLFLRETMGSFGSKHEHKTAVCALILSEIAEDIEFIKEEKK
jgi:hypothetical protein